MASKHFDLIVIGSGPAGEKGAAQTSYFGKSVALVEKMPVYGGTAANTGTLPSKTLRETALVLSGFRNRALDGLEVQFKKEVSVRDFLTRERLLKQRERARIRENLDRHGVVQYEGAGSFVDAHTIAVRPTHGEEFTLEGDVVLIATGSYPFRPPGFPFDDQRVYDSDEILDLEEIPPSMLVVGGGVIGCEYACMFAILGVEVTIVEKRGKLIGSLDGEVSEALRARMEVMGIRVIVDDSVAEVRGDEYEVRLKSGTVLKANTILVSSGRCGTTGSLGLDRVGIVANERGIIQVDENYRTSVPNVYAAGDVIGNPGLASTAMDQARIAMGHAFNFQYRPGLATVLPYGIYTIPECSMAGETEESLAAKQIPYVIGKASYADNARGQIVGDIHGFLKLLFHEETMKLLGVHMIGELATEIIHVGLTALLMNEDADLFIQTCYNYPTLSELYKYATYDAMGRRAARRKAPPSAG
jgi:NAD(P) transhydrogenase